MTIEPTNNQQDSTPTSQKTWGSMIGEIVLLMSQTPGHKQLQLQDLEWLLMPAIILGQYKLFRDSSPQGQPPEVAPACSGRPVGAALWGYLDEAAEKRLKTVGKLQPQDWGNNAKLDQAKGLVRQPGGTLWLIEVIAPFHTDENKQRDQMLGDLMQTAFKGQLFKLMHVNPESKKREELVLGG